MFTIYHDSPDCLPDDKGSYIAAVPFFSLARRSPAAPFYFAETRACRRITFRCRVGLYRADTCPTYRLVIIAAASYLAPLCQSFQSKGLFRRSARQLGSLICLV